MNISCVTLTETRYAFYSVECLEPIMQRIAKETAGRVVRLVYSAPGTKSKENPMGSGYIGYAVESFGST